MIEQSTFHQSFFYAHDLEENDDNTLQQICLNDNLADLFAKSLPTGTFKKLMHNIEMHNSEISSDVSMRGSKLY